MNRLRWTLGLIRYVCLLTLVHLYLRCVDWEHLQWMRTSSATRRLRQPWLTRLLVGALAIGHGIGGTGSVNQTLNAALSPIAKLSVPASLILTAGATKFAPFSGTLGVNYRARTTPGGSGCVLSQFF